MTAHRLTAAQENRRVNLTASAGMGGETVGAGNHHLGRKEEDAVAFLCSLQPGSWRAALTWLAPWLLVAAFAAVGGSATALLILGVRP